MLARALKYSLHSYQELEREEQKKYEYYDGDVFAFAGASTDHNRIAGNIFYEIKKTLSSTGSSCEVFNSDQKLHLPMDNAYVYPDCTVYCSDMEASEEDDHALTKPKVIIEILSKSTANQDRGAKFYKYKQIETLEQYVLVDQYEPAVDIFTIIKDTRLMKMTRVEGLDKSFELSSIGVAIIMEDLYQNVYFNNKKSDL